MPNTTVYTDVLLPLPLPNLFTYQVPQEYIPLLETGKRVIVPFGMKKMYTALVKNIHQNKPAHYKTKNILSVLDEHPVVNKTQLSFLEWLSNYYMSTPGEIFKAAIPSGLRLESETIIMPSYKNSNEKLSPTEELIMQIIIDKQTITIQKLSHSMPGKNIMQAVKTLIDKELIYAEEKIKSRYKPKLETYININTELANTEKLHAVFKAIEKAPKQLKLFMAYLSMTNFQQNKTPQSVKKSILVENIQSYNSSLKALLDKNIFQQEEKEVNRLIEKETGKKPVITLNQYQKETFDDIKRQWIENNVVLLHGITSSGKTEIYIKLIEEQLGQKKQVLYLLPEIALTTQIINRLKKTFGEKVGVYHSKFSEAERVEVWNKILNHHYSIILGVRSSVFLPFDNLGLIIVDEEHETTYKQFDPAPRYHARDSSIYLARLHQAKVLLGTATPSIESYYNSTKGKYGLTELNTRHKNIKLPEIILVDTLLAYKRKKMKSHFSEILLEKLTETIHNKEQAILFQNRRGFSPFVQCTDCGWIPYCKNCDVTLTYHRFSNNLVCHYCGFSIKVPNTCHACGSNAIQTKGFGTEKIEDEIKIFFPEVRIARMDLDTTRSKHGHEKIINAFENHEIDILIGTQMISKGLNFENVNLVGILNADNLLNFPDFRAFEKSYQLMAQVSGRAGRSNKQGVVVIQTSEPEHAILKNVLDNNYKAMFNDQIHERKQFKYPPFYRLIEIIVKHKNQEKAYNASIFIVNILKKYFGDAVIGPHDPLINKIQNKFIKKILIKLPKSNPLQSSKDKITTALDKCKSTNAFKTISLSVNVDPY